jgi:hypothetical protein
MKILAAATLAAPLQLPLAAQKGSKLRMQPRQR